MEEDDSFAWCVGVACGNSGRCPSVRPVDTMTAEPYPRCPRCRMEAIRLTPDGEACLWCKGRAPVTVDVWRKLVEGTRR